MSKTYAIITFNPATGTEETVPVTKEVYDEFRRGIWRIDKSDLKYITHTYPMSCLIGDDDDSEDEFHEYADTNFNLEEIISTEFVLSKLREGVKGLSPVERRIVYYLFFEECSEKEVAEIFSISQQAIHKRKIKILKKLKNFLKSGC